MPYYIIIIYYYIYYYILLLHIIFIIYYICIVYSLLTDFYLKETDSHQYLYHTIGLSGLFIVKHYESTEYA